MEKQINCTFCDYCEPSLKTVSNTKCGICSKDICESCIDTLIDINYGYANSKPVCCKHCINTVSDMIYRNEIKVVRLKDYRMSGTSSSIDIGSYYRYFYDELTGVAYKKASQIFYDMMSDAVNKRKNKIDIALKEKQIREELEKELEERISKLKNK